MSDLPFHPIANLFPLMEGGEFEQFKGDVRANGLREALWIYDGQILDGRNRYRACRELGIEPMTQAWDGDDPVAFVVSLNLRRRHLTESQRALIADSIAKMGEGRPPETRPIGLVSQEQAAEMLNVGINSVKRAARVRRTGAPGLKRAVKAGEVRLGPAAEVASLPEAEQEAVVAKGPEAVREKAAEIRRGKSRVNGQLVDDPEDIAAARAAGKIAPDVVVEISEPERSPGEDDVREGEEGPIDPTEADLDDPTWLETLPARGQLPSHRLKGFDRDALAYRKLTPHRRTFAHHASRIAKGDGEYTFRVRRFLRSADPKHWLRCVAPEHGGCGGTGTLGVIGQCPKCFGRGYYIP